MALNVLDEAGLPPAGIERTLAHHFLGRRSRLAQRILYALVGGPRRNAEFVPLLEGKSPNNLTKTLRLLEDEGVILPVVDGRTLPPAKGYRLSGLGYVVVDWMRRYEFLEDLEAARAQFAPPSAHASA